MEREQGGMSKGEGVRGKGEEEKRERPPFAVADTVAYESETQPRRWTLLRESKSTTMHGWEQLVINKKAAVMRKKYNVMHF